MKQLKKTEIRAIEVIVLLASIVSTIFGIYLYIKELSTRCKINKALDLYISEHKYRVSEYECMQDLCADEAE